MTKRRYMSTTPANTEQLRTKYEVFTNLWLLARSRQPGRNMYEDLTESTWMKFLKELLIEDNFALHRVIQGQVWGHTKLGTLPGTRARTRPAGCAWDGHVFGAK